MKEELISLAKGKEFISKYHLGDCFPIEDYDFGNLGDHWYLWMCELQKWLREKHNLHITIFSSSQESWMFRVTKPHQKLEDGLYGEDYFIYEEALEEGLKEGLTLIK